MSAFLEGTFICQNHIGTNLLNLIANMNSNVKFREVCLNAQIYFWWSVYFCVLFAITRTQFIFLIKHNISAISGICVERLSLKFLFHAFELQNIKSYQKGALGKRVYFHGTATINKPMHHHCLFS